MLCFYLGFVAVKIISLIFAESVKGGARPSDKKTAYLTG